MNHSEFKEICKKLEFNFDKALTAEKADIWFEKIRPWGKIKFAQVVENILEQNDRFPSLAVILKSGELVRELKKKSESEPKLPDCDVCDSSGMVSAIRKSEKWQGYKTAFRCPSCFRWAGKYSEEIPIWESKFSEKFQLQVNWVDLKTTKEERAEVVKVFPQFGHKRGQPTQEQIEKEQIRKRSLEADRRRENYQNWNEDW